MTMLNRILSRGAITVLVASGLVVGIQSSGSAHRNTIVPIVRCADEIPQYGDAWDLTWQIDNSENIPETVTASNRAVVPVGTVIGDTNQPYDAAFTERILSSDALDITLTVSGRWSNGVRSTNSGSVQASDFPRDCRPPAPKDEFQYRDLPPVTDCGEGTVTWVHQYRMRTFAWDVETQSWLPSPWSAWHTDSTTTTPVSAGYCQMARANWDWNKVDKCNCWRDSASIVANRLKIRVTKERVTRTKWVFHLTGRVYNKQTGDRYMLSTKPLGRGERREHVRVVVRTTNKDCAGAHTPGPHPNLPADHCRGEGC